MAVMSEKPRVKMLTALRSDHLAAPIPSRRKNLDAHYLDDQDDSSSLDEDEDNQMTSTTTKRLHHSQPSSRHKSRRQRPTVVEADHFGSSCIDGGETHSTCEHDGDSDIIDNDKYDNSPFARAKFATATAKNAVDETQDSKYPNNEPYVVTQATHQRPISNGHISRAFTKSLLSRHIGTGRARPT
jgi:hypothetical protein